METGKMEDVQRVLENRKAGLLCIFPLSVPTLRTQRGSSLIEMALTLPVILVMLLGTLDLGRAVYAQNVISNAAREGARYGAISPGDSQAVQAETESFIIGLDPDSVTVTLEESPETIRVTVSYEFEAVTPMIGQLLGQGGAVTFTAVSTINIEGPQ